jgi:hypothetical protein
MPSKKPSNVPSKAPTHLPTLERQPTSIPSSSLTGFPTKSTAPPSVSTSPTCFIDTGVGNFGDVVTLYAETIAYIYEMETDPSSTASISLDVIPSLEKQILISLIPNFFDDYCAESVRRQLLARSNQETEGTMMGISSLPADKVMARGKISFLQGFALFCCNPFYNSYSEFMPIMLIPLVPFA